MKFCDNAGDSSYFLTSLSDCLCHVSFSRYSPLSVEVVEKSNKCKGFWPPIFSGGATLTFLQRIVSATYRPPFEKVWLSFVCWSPSAKPGNEEECGIYGGWVKTTVQFESVWEPKFMSSWDDVADFLLFATHLPSYVYPTSFRRYGLLNLPLSCEINQKGGFWAPDL